MAAGRDLAYLVGGGGGYSFSCRRLAGFNNMSLLNFSSTPEPCSNKEQRKNILTYLYKEAHHDQNKIIKGDLIGYSEKIM